mmetsp:Transcript_29659/g.44763  ORF Transcript_29659/g.44763 Transcript_29659/m.44763 type:complete len:96 (+) Transcript_29659:118-405(+)
MCYFQCHCLSLDRLLSWRRLQQFIQHYEIEGWVKRKTLLTHGSFHTKHCFRYLFFVCFSAISEVTYTFNQWPFSLTSVVIILHNCHYANMPIHQH